MYIITIKSAKEEFEDGSSCCSTPNGIYHGSVGSDTVSFPALARIWIH